MSRLDGFAGGLWGEDHSVPNNSTYCWEVPNCWEGAREPPWGALMRQSAARFLARWSGWPGWGWLALLAALAGLAGPGWGWPAWLGLAWLAGRAWLAGLGLSPPN